MTDRFLAFVIYATTPIMLVLGLGIMYLLIGDHEWFGYMAGGYVLLLAILFLVKISIYRYLLSRRDAALAATAAKTAATSAVATPSTPSSPGHRGDTPVNE
ncbi:MAG: hypothetical protein RBU27_10260 [Bacteroidota bacterium]|nr:hypothetical protein [Bacteroidota bacterium]